MVEVAIAGSVTGAIVRVVFTKLSSQAIEEIGAVYGLEENLRDLKQTLDGIKSLLADAESRLTRDPNNSRLERWLDDLRDAAYEADDVIDELQYKQLRRKAKDGRGQANPFRRFVPYGLRVPRKIKNLQKRLKKILDLAGAHQLEPTTTPPRTLVLDAASRETSSLPDAQALIGRDRKKERVIELLRSAQGAARGETAAVVSITGMGGIGKTTLAQHVYHDEEIQRHFDLKMWVCVSDDFDQKKLTSKAVESATGKPCDNFENLDSFQNKLLAVLAGKKFLLVLDDVWNEDANRWCSFKKPLVSGGRSGSKILATTRSRKVAEIMLSTESMIPLKELSDDDLWSLFKSFAFGGSDTARHPNLERVGEQIAKKLKGSPLAAKTVGCLLSSNSNEGYWGDILESEIWKLEQKEHDIMPSLRLSYEHLPEEVKPCFAFCSLFPKDHRFDREQLVSMWTAHDYIRPRERKLPEDVGMDYINLLLSRSMFQPDRLSPYLFTMHDLMHDLAQMVSRGECYTARDDEEFREAPKTVRHLYISYNRLEVPDLNEVQNLRNIRTLILNLPVVEASERSLDLQVISKAERLRLLRISSGWHRVIVSVPVPFQFKHLRYLDLDCRLNEALPQSISSLYNLRELEYNDGISVPTGMIRNLPNLRDVNIHGTYNGIELSGEIGMLSELRRLKNGVPSEGNHGISELSGTNQLRELEIYGLENVSSKEDAIEARLPSKEHLDGLKFTWTGRSGLRWSDCNDEEVLEGLQPPQNIRELRIENYNSVRCPSWMNDQSLPYIEEICFIACSSLSSLPRGLSELSSLRDLSVIGCPSIRSFPDGGLPSSIRRLEVDDLANVADLKAAGLDQTNLEELRISKCPSLASLPENGLPSSLRELYIYDLPKVPDLEAARLDQTKLERMYISICPSLASLPTNRLPSALRELRISDLPNVTDLEVAHLDQTNLEELQIYECPSLTSLSTNGLPSSLLDLVVYDLPNVADLEAARLDQTKLQRIYISKCPSLASLPTKGLPSSLRELHISDLPNVTDLNAARLDQTNLEELQIHECPSLSSLQENGLPSSLRVLNIYKLPNVSDLEAARHDQTNLEELRISKCPSLSSLPENGLPSSLRELYIDDLPNVADLEVARLNQTNLKELWISKCPSLASLPANGLPSSLRRLLIFECPVLEQRCRKDDGPDWITISQIPKVEIGDA